MVNRSSQPSAVQGASAMCSGYAMVQTARLFQQLYNRAQGGPEMSKKEPNDTALIKGKKVLSGWNDNWAQWQFLSAPKWPP